MWKVVLALLLTSTTRASPAEAFILGSKGTDVCPAGSSGIADVFSCESAADSLGLHYQYSGSWSNYPPGCFASSADGRAWYNYNLGAMTETYLVCRQEIPPTMTPPTTTMKPTTTTTRKPTTTTTMKRTTTTKMKPTTTTAKPATTTSITKASTISTTMAKPATTTSTTMAEATTTETRTAVEPATTASTTMPEAATSTTSTTTAEPATTTSTTVADATTTTTTMSEPATIMSTTKAEATSTAEPATTMPTTMAEATMPGTATVTTTPEPLTTTTTTTVKPTTTGQTVTPTATTQGNVSCMTPTTQYGFFELIEGSGHAGSAWTLICNDGYMPVGGNTVVCSFFGISSAVPTCGVDKGCNVDSALLLTSGAVSTNCSAKMANQQTCAAVCSGDAQVEGTIKCVSGRLVDASHCISGKGLTPVEVLKVFGTVYIGVTGSPTSASLTKAIADAFVTKPDYVSVSSDAFPSSDGRLLSAIQRSPPRFLSSVRSVITVQYTVAIKPNSKQDAFSAFSDAMALSSLSSEVGRAFAESMKSSGVTVHSVVYFNDPAVVAKSIILENSAGVIEKFDVSAVSPQPARDKKDSLGVFKIIALVIGCLLLVILGFFVYFFLLIRRKYMEG